MGWLEELKNNITTIEELSRHIDLSPEEEECLQRVVDKHPMSITGYYISLINGRDPEDPIRRMVVPSREEMDLTGSYDTGGEIANMKVLGLQHKYPQTALVLLTNLCPTYCRFCFRKRLVGLPNREVARRFREVVNYIRTRAEITNVLISGGDPLVLSTGMIEGFLKELSSISHLNFIRIGTRVLATFPQRVLDDPGLLGVFERFSDSGKKIYVVTHFNHPRELTQESREAVSRLLKTGVVLNNQAVLLKGVNDAPGVLASLMGGIVGMGIVPYYLFQCRPVKRVKKRFLVPLDCGYRIVEEAKKRVDGLAKKFRYVMSHRTGKVEIVGIDGGEMYFKYHQAVSPGDAGRLFKKRLKEGAGWLDDLG
jgi:KamA family protein